MERLILPLLVFLPFTLIAQQTGLRGEDQPGPAASRLEDPSSSAGSANISLASSANGTSASSESVSEGILCPANEQFDESTKD